MNKKLEGSTLVNIDVDCSLIDITHRVDTDGVVYLPQNANFNRRSISHSSNIFLNTNKILLNADKIDAKKRKGGKEDDKKQKPKPLRNEHLLAYS